MTENRVRRLWPVAAGAGYLLVCCLIEYLSGAWRASYTGYPDEPSHFVGAVMFRDWVVSGQWLKPFQFAVDYYRHYPYFAVGYWPPVFSAFTGTSFLVFGVGRVQALLVPCLSAAGTAWLIFLLLRKRVGAVAALCAGAIYLSLPAVQAWAGTVMVDHLTAFLSLACGLALCRYLEAPGIRNGVVTGVLCAVAILSKFGAGYLVAVPVFAVLLLRRFRLLATAGYLVQPALVALIAGPWIYWTRGLAYYGLPAEHPPATLARALSFVTPVFHAFPPVLLVLVAIGLLLLLLSPRRWGIDTGVVGLLCAGHVTFLFLSPVISEPRYLLVPIACVLLLSAAGWGAALSRLPLGPGRARAVPVALAVVTAAWLVVSLGRMERAPADSIAPVVQVVLSNPDWTGQRVLAPSDLEGAFIAEYVTQERRRPVGFLVRPYKALARANWFGQDYRCRFRTPEEMLGYFRETPVKLIVWHERTVGAPLEHEFVLARMLQQYPSVWRKATTPRPAWTIYQYVP